MRLLLVRQADLPRVANVRTLDDLRRVSAGQGKGWVVSIVLSAVVVRVGLAGLTGGVKKLVMK